MVKTQDPALNQRTIHSITCICLCVPFSFPCPASPLLPERITVPNSLYHSLDVLFCFIPNV